MRIRKKGRIRNAWEQYLGRIMHHNAESQNLVESSIMRPQPQAYQDADRSHDVYRDQTIPIHLVPAARTVHNEQ